MYYNEILKPQMNHKTQFLDPDQKPQMLCPGIWYTNQKILRFEHYSSKRES